MEKLSALAHRKKTPPPPPPVKVVYISSPVKVTATAAEFRALVQKLTGRHSGASADFVDCVTPAAADDELGSAGSSGEEYGAFCSAPAEGLGRVGGCDVEVENSLVAPVEVLDEAAAFDAEMLENFSSFVSYLSTAL